MSKLKDLDRVKAMEASAKIAAQTKKFVRPEDLSAETTEATEVPLATVGVDERKEGASAPSLLAAPTKEELLATLIRGMMESVLKLTPGGRDVYKTIPDQHWADTLKALADDKVTLPVIKTVRAASGY